MISRRQLLYFSFLFSFYYPIANLRYFATADDKNNDCQYPMTLSILHEAYWAEIIANKNYVRYCRKALSENYENIAYLFYSLSISEKIHAENYLRLIVSLGSTLKAKEISFSVSDTKTNLNVAATKELEKIKQFYPDILKKLSSESHDQAVINCMYSWKSHQQHEEIISNIKKYSGIFFRPLAKKIERMKLDYYVCEICGSTVNKKPEKPCEVCNYPLSHYKKLTLPHVLPN